MKSAKNKFGAAKNKAMGSIKKGVGKATGNHELEAKGEQERVKGHLQSAMENVKDAAK